MAGIGRDDGDYARAGDPGQAVAGHFEFALDHLTDFFLGMEVLVDGRATLEVAVREGHAGRVEIASVPAERALDGCW